MTLVRTLAFIALAACSSSANPEPAEPTGAPGTNIPTTPAVTAETGAGSGSAEPFVGVPKFEDDHDGDDIVNKCDQCPNGAESWNGLEDLDGCPDEATDQIVEHPTNRYPRALIQFEFATATTTPSTPFAKWEIPDDVDAIACIGAADGNAELAAQRTKLLCDHVRGYLSKARPELQVVPVAISGAPTYRRPNATWHGATGELRVIRSRDATTRASVDIWRLEGGQLVEVAPRKTKHPRPVTAECMAQPARTDFRRSINEYQ